MSADIGDGAVHFVLIVGKDSEFRRFCGQGLNVLHGIVLFDSEQDKKAVLDLCDFKILDGNGSMFDALNDDFHSEMLQVVFAREKRID